MRKVIIPLVIIVVLLTTTPTASDDLTKKLEPIHEFVPHMDHSNLAAASSTGVNLDGVEVVSRTVLNGNLSIANTYLSPDSHQGVVDLSSYSIPGWTLFMAGMDVYNITAAPEREVVGSNDSPSTNFLINEYTADNYYNQLTQGFYNQPHDGAIINYSINYFSSSYVPALRGTAFLLVRSDYSNTTSNSTIFTILQPEEAGFAWKTVDCGLENLTMNTVYYVTIDGRDLHEDSIVFTYPSIYWGTDPAAGSFETKRFSTEFAAWSLDLTHEALLNYTYIPWNQTGNAPLIFGSAEEISLTANSTPLSGMSWNVTNGPDSLESITFESNQSAYLFHNLTMWYKRTVSASTLWTVSSSGGQVEWNATIDVSYPSVPGAVTRILNVSKPFDWGTNGLYNSTTPAVNYGNFMDHGKYVLCSSMTNGTWTLTFTAHNYVTDVKIANGELASILDNVDINSTLEDGTGTPSTSGTTNLTIWYDGAVIHAPANVSVSTGFAQYLWDIDTTTSNNGTYMIEVYWANGTEAGYLTEDIFVYLPTILTPSQVHIDAYTESSFVAEVNFTDIFTPRPIDNTLASVEYSLDGGANTSMTGHSDGIWNTTIPTVGLGSGMHTVTIYAEGYAFENQTLEITVLLTHETQQLSWDWSNNDNITYYDSTNLTVYYLFANGTSIQGATVNVTADGNTWPMTWNTTSGGYWIKLNGTNFSTIPYIYTLNVSAWKSGHQPQYNDTMTLEVRTAVGVDLIVNWNNLDYDLLYIDQFHITANYTDSGVPVSDGTVTLTFNGSSPVLLTYNISDFLYHAVLNARDYGVGSWNLIVRAQKIGLGNVTRTQDFIIHEDTPFVTSSWSDSSFTADYDTSAPLSITVTDSASTPITDASVTAILLGTSYIMIHEGSGVYSAALGPNATSGLHGVQITMVRAGFTTTIMDLNLTILSTTELVMITFDPSNSWYENETLTFSVVYRDSFYSTPISGGSVNITIDGIVYNTEYSDGVYSTTIFLHFTLGPYIVTIDASAEFCNPSLEQPMITVVAKTHVYITLDIVGASEGQSAQIQATLRDNATDGPVSGVTLYFEITIIFRNETILIDEEIYAFPTNEEGVAIFAYLIPQDAEFLEVVVRYLGTPPVWSTDTLSSVPVSPSVFGALMTFILTPPGMYIVIAFLLLGTVAAFYNKRVKPKKRAAMDSLERQLQDFADLETLRHFMAVYLDRGTCVFYHPFADERIQPDLISGFIAAITSVYGEIKGDGVRGTLEEIQYHGLRLNSYSGKYVIGILILEGEMTKLLRERLQFFIEMFEKHHSVYLEDWDGLIDCFDPEWVVSNLIGSFNYTMLLPHKFGKKRKVSKLDGKILDLIGTRRNNRREFYLRELVKPVAALMGASEARAMDKLLAMEDKGLIEPIGIQTVLQRQGLGLANGEDETITAPVSRLATITAPISRPKPTPPLKAAPAKPKPATKKIDPMDIGDIAVEPEPIKPREGIGAPLPGKPTPIDPVRAKDIDKATPKLAMTPAAKDKEPKTKPAEKKKVPKEEMSEADKFITEVIDLLAKEKKKDKSD